MGCSASHNLLTLTPFYMHRSKVQTGEFRPIKMKSLDFQEALIWKPLTKKFPRFENITLPEDLTNMKQIEMTPLIEELNSAQSSLLTDSWPVNNTLNIVAIVSSALALGLIAILVVRYYLNKKHSANVVNLREAQGYEICFPLNREAPSHLRSPPARDAPSRPT